MRYYLIFDESDYIGENKSKNFNILFIGTEHECINTFIGVLIPFYKQFGEFYEDLIANRDDIHEIMTNDFHYQIVNEEIIITRQKEGPLIKEISFGVSGGLNMGFFGFLIPVEK